MNNDFDWNIPATGYSIPEIADAMELGTTRLSTVTRPGDANFGDTEVAFSKIKPMLLVKVAPAVTQQLVTAQKLFPNLAHESVFKTGFFEGSPHGNPASLLILIVGFGTDLYPVFFDFMNVEHLNIIGKLAAGEELIVNFCSVDANGNAHEVIYAAPLPRNAIAQFLGAFVYIKNRVKNTKPDEWLWSEEQYEAMVADFSQLTGSELLVMINNLEDVARQQAGDPPDVLFMAGNN